ncbi:MAG: Uma2 family endonuclease [Methylobacterium frigidaeris]
MPLGTEARDRFEKWKIHQRLPSLQHYVLVARDRPSVEAFDRVGEAWAGLGVLEGPDAVLDLPALGLGLSLRGIYRRVIGD